MNVTEALNVIGAPKPIIDAFNKAQNWQIIKHEGPNSPRTWGLMYLGFIYEWLESELRALAAESKLLSDDFKKALNALEEENKLLTEAITLCKQRLGGVLSQAEGLKAVNAAYAAGIYSSIKVAKQPSASTIAEFESRVAAFKVFREALDKIKEELCNYGIVDAAGNISLA